MFSNMALYAEQQMEAQRQESKSEGDRGNSTCIKEVLFSML